MLAAGLVLAALAALVHVYIFWLESLAWSGARSRRIFRLRTDAEVEHTRVLAFNQGFYNLFLAVVTGVGIGLVMAGAVAVGVTLVLAGTGSMLAAAVVLALAAPGRGRAALVQGLFPLLAIALTIAGALLLP